MSQGAFRCCPVCGHTAATGEPPAPADAPGPPVIAFVGHSGSGKTTLVEQVIRLLVARGLRVAAVKHDPKGHATYDVPGKDSWRFAAAGAHLAALAGPHTIARFEPVEADTPLVVLAARLAADTPVDLVVAEGYHTQSGFPKIEVYRPAQGRPPRCPDPDVIAIVTDAPAAGAIACLPLDDPAAVADFVVRHVSAAWVRPSAAMSGDDTHSPVLAGYGPAA